MKCNNHPNREAVHLCASCGIPLCDDCVEEPIPGRFFCFQCAMVQAVSGAGTTLRGKREKATEKKLEEKKAWGPFHYFVTVSIVLMAVMWGVILFGGQKAPGNKIDLAQNPRIFLFMVNSSIKRYAHFEGNKYPETIMDMIPKYLKLSDENLKNLNILSYKKDPDQGYILSYANKMPGEIDIIITPKSIKYKSTLSEGVQNE